MSAATVLVDGSIVMRICVNEVSFGAEFLENAVADDAGGTISAIDTDFEI